MKIKSLNWAGSVAYHRMLVYVLCAKKKKERGEDEGMEGGRILTNMVGQC